MRMKWSHPNVLSEGRTHGETELRDLLPHPVHLATKSTERNEGRGRETTLVIDDVNWVVDNFPDLRIISLSSIARHIPHLWQ